MAPSRIVRLANYTEQAIVLLLKAQLPSILTKQTMNTMNTVKNDTVPTASRPTLLLASAPGLLALLRLPL